jgi:hypothetical protein
MRGSPRHQQTAPQRRVQREREIVQIAGKLITGKTHGFSGWTLLAADGRADDGPTPWTRPT